ncbi:MULTISPECIES: Hpt domain-containing protein [unclassified Pseudarthrobacter]|uniref:Hpt domain-containing protein n=1 Tax=unclassified Pseudarthrobacter TaxID=2647000 RepID=UPI003641C0F5
MLDRLRLELDDDVGWLLFLENFLSHLPRRIEKLRSGVFTADYEACMDAVLSLKISSQMVGAECLAGLAAELQGYLDSPAVVSWPSTRSVEFEHFLNKASVCAGQTAAVLRARFAQEVQRQPPR